LLLDEATSHLDAAAEERVNSALKALPMTRIVIAHRPQTIMAMERVIYLKDGKVELDRQTGSVERILGVSTV
jgi:ATP-binding cassette, subfamily B, bacterial CvaB/MchF/RaxB